MYSKISEGVFLLQKLKNKSAKPKGENSESSQDDSPGELADELQKSWENIYTSLAMFETD